LERMLQVTRVENPERGAGVYYVHQSEESIQQQRPDSKSEYE
jgi:hypothetical protein